MITPEQEQYLHNYADNIDRYYESIADETLQEQIKHMPASATTQQLINFVCDSIYYGGPQTQYDFRLKTPCTVMVGGKSKSGKTELLFDLLRQWRFITDDTAGFYTKRIYWFYGTYDQKQENCLKEIYDGFRDELQDANDSSIALHTIPGLESQQAETAKEEMRDAIVILDDLMDEMMKNDKMSQFFTRESHHRNLCMFFVWQDIFPKHKHGSTISKNTDYKIIFDNPSCRDSVRRMLGKMYPKAKQAAKWRKKFSTPSNTAHPIRTHVVRELERRERDRQLVTELGVNGVDLNNPNLARYVAPLVPADLLESLYRSTRVRRRQALITYFREHFNNHVPSHIRRILGPVPVPPPPAAVAAVARRREARERRRRQASPGYQPPSDAEVDVPARSPRPHRNSAAVAPNYGVDFPDRYDSDEIAEAARANPNFQLAAAALPQAQQESSSSSSSNSSISSGVGSIGSLSDDAVRLSPALYNHLLDDDGAAAYLPDAAAAAAARPPVAISPIVPRVASTSPPAAAALTEEEQRVTWKTCSPHWTWQRRPQRRRSYSSNNVNGQWR
eukprot:gene13613-biopygen10891